MLRQLINALGADSRRTIQDLTASKRTDLTRFEVSSKNEAVTHQKDDLD
ncbi:hypothetical protein O4H61_20290 [Roseovarius aestuarii]|nr:hypothetical protein [Roseovarius aestuarii]